MQKKANRLLVQAVGEVTCAFLLEPRICEEPQIREIGDQLFDTVDSNLNIRLLLDFSKVEYLSSAVLGKLIALHKKVKAEKGELALCSIKPSIQEIFKITKLDKVFTIHENPQKGVAAFQSKNRIIKR
jgi:anti-sigma B factor antagonist